MNVRLLYILAAAFALNTSYAFAASNEAERGERPAFEAMHAPDFPEGDFAFRGHAEGENGEEPPAEEIRGNKGEKNKKLQKHQKAPKAIKGMKGHSGMPPNMCNITDDEVIGEVKTVDATFAKKLASLKENSIRQYDRALNVLKMHCCFAKNKKDDKAKEMLAKTVARVSLETDISALSEKYRAAKEADKTSIKAELKAALEKLFDLRVEEMQARMKGMEEELASRKQKLEERKASKDRIVADRLEQLTGGGFRW